MIQSPQIVQSAAQLHAFIPLLIPRSEIQLIMGPAVGEIIAAVTAQGVGPSGPFFTYHIKMEPGIFNFQVCFPVRAAIVPTGRVQAGTLPAARVARTIYCGAYEGLGQAWGEFKRWVDSAGHQSRPDLWESYQIGPDRSDDATTWRTELNQPLM